MLTQKHLDWLNINDGMYEVLPRQHKFTRDNTEYISKVDVAFNNTMFAFNENGLSQAIDRIIEVYPESLDIDSHIVINGHLVPKPLETPLMDGVIYYMPNIFYTDHPHTSCWWNSNLDLHIMHLNKNICHLDKKAAIIHAKALLCLNT